MCHNDVWGGNLVSQNQILCHLCTDVHNQERCINNEMGRDRFLKKSGPNRGMVSFHGGL